jgi:two-component system CheB/CheR fusion protein
MGEQEADNVLLGAYVPPTLLVDDQLRVVRFYGNTEPYLRVSQDRPSLHLLRMVRDELVFEFQELVERSNREEGTVVRNGIQLGTGADTRQLSLEITPLRRHGGKWKLVIIRELTSMDSRRPDDKSLARTLAQKDQRILVLEKEATELRSLLVAAGEDGVRMQRTLQIANEDIMASNEELQSVNEQLQSVNEQLLSFNVEVNTVNEDLSVRVRDLELSMEYAHAIVNSLRRPMVVLQDDLRIRQANEPFCSFFGISVVDTLGQSLYTVANGILDRDELRKALRQALAKKTPSADLELRVGLDDHGERILAIGVTRMPKVKNIRPGLVLALEDITERKATEKLPGHGTSNRPSWP